jgi:hypothetical protein
MKIKIEKVQLILLETIVFGFLIGLIIGLVRSIPIMLIYLLFLLVGGNLVLNFKMKKKGFWVNLSLIFVLIFTFSSFLEYIFFVIGFVISTLNLVYSIKKKKN